MKTVAALVTTLVCLFVAPSADAAHHPPIRIAQPVVANTRWQPLVVSASAGGVFQSTGVLTGNIVPPAMATFTQDLRVYRVAFAFTDSEANATLQNFQLYSISRNPASPDPQLLDIASPTVTAAGAICVLSPQVPYYLPANRELRLTFENRVGVTAPFTYNYRVEFQYAHSNLAVPPDQLY